MLQGCLLRQCVCQWDILLIQLGEHPFKALGMDVNGAFQSTWGLFGILMLSTIVAFATIFLYKNRMLQIRMSIFNSLLLVGYYIAFFAFYLH